MPQFFEFEASSGTNVEMRPILVIYTIAGTSHLQIRVTSLEQLSLAEFNGE